MATDPVLQWKTHVTDSTDQDTILGNLDVLEQFALSINGGDKYTISDGQSQVTGTLSEQFNNIRKGIKNGTIKPTEWKSSKELGNITKALTNASSGKISGLGERLGTAEEGLENKLDSKDFSEFKTGDFKTATESIASHGETLSGYGTRITNAEKKLGQKLDLSTFNQKVKTLASRPELENLKKLLNKEVSHWTAESTPAPLEYTASAKVKASTQPWGKDEDPERHADDLCTVIGEKQTDKGVSYRFIKHPTEDTYKWLNVIDNDGALALGNLKTFEEKYNKRQTAIDNSLAEKQPKGNYIEKKEFDANNTKVDQEIKELKGTYKVTVTTQGEIRNGQIVGGKTYGGKPAILHTAHVYGILGTKITDTKILNKLKWTVNSGRTSFPEQRFVTGATCYVTADDFVRVLHTQGSTPQFYDIELNSSF